MFASASMYWIPLFLRLISFLLEIYRCILSCANSSLLMPHPCRILQKYTTFGESDTHPLTFSKSPSNIGCILFSLCHVVLYFGVLHAMDLGSRGEIHSLFSCSKFNLDLLYSTRETGTYVINES